MIKKEFRYMKMADILRTEILSGYLKPGQFLLPEKELCQVYAISRNSLRQALDLLTNEGLLIKMVGRGTMVAPEINLTQGEGNVLNILCPESSSFVDKALPLLIAKFNEKYPNIEVRKFGTGFHNAQLLQDLTYFGVNVDLVIMQDQAMSQMPLEAYMPLDDITNDFPNIESRVLEAFQHKSRTYAAPLTFSPIFLAANPLLFEQQGATLPQDNWNMSQFITTAKQLNSDTNGDGLIDRYGFGLSNSLFRWPVLMMKYGYLLQMNEAGQLNTERLLEALTFMQNIVHRDQICPKMEVNQWGQLGHLFYEQKLAMLLTSTLATDMKHKSFPVTVIPLPEEAEAISGGLAIANGMMIPRSSHNTDFAQLFIRMALEQEFQLQMMEEARFLSIYREVNKQGWSKGEREALGIEPDQMKSLYFINELLQNSYNQQMINEAMRRFWSGYETPQEVMDKLVKVLAK